MHPGNNKVYDTRAWTFFTGAPVRATPLVKDNVVYVGNAKGQFFAIDKKNGRLKWVRETGAAIHSTAVYDNGRIIFADNHQTVYALDGSTGKTAWKFDMGPKQDYPWRFDYYYSSPTIVNGKLLIGGDDGFFYALDAATGKLVWKFKCKGIVRGSAAINEQSVYFGDTEASLYAIDLQTGQQRWVYKINGDTMRNESYGFDRRAITSTPVVAGNKILFGARDGFLYCIDKNGSNIWKADHRVSWVISTVAIKDSIVVTGTSDGRFVQALNLETGKEIWKYRTPLAVWASPLILDDKVYAGCFDGQLFCLDLKTGRRISQYKTGGKILSSPVWNDGLLYLGSDDGNLYSMSGHIDNRWHKDEPRYVFYETGVSTYFRNGSDLAIKNYLQGCGFKLMNTDSLTTFLSGDHKKNAVIVFSSLYFAPAITANGRNSLLRKFLDEGGRIILTGTNPLLYKIDEKTKQPYAFNPHNADTILSLDYGAGDTRTFMGDFPSFPTAKGIAIGLPDFWTSALFIDESQVDIILGRNENGKVSAFVKNYSNGGKLVQLWMNADSPDRLDAIVKAAEWNLE